MKDRLEKVLTQALRCRAESAVARPFTIYQVRQRASRILLAQQLTAALAVLVLFGVVWWLKG